MKDKEQNKEVSREENVGTLHIARLHVQLRRLLKHSNFSDNIILTAIPGKWFETQQCYFVIKISIGNTLTYLGNPRFSKVAIVF